MAARGTGAADDEAADCRVSGRDHAIGSESMDHRFSITSSARASSLSGTVRPRTLRFMRYSASEKLEIIELVEQSSLSIRRTLAPIGIPRSTFYDWYSRYQSKL